MNASNCRNSFERWLQLLDAWQIAPENATYQALLDAYAEPHRHYHHFEHIDACLSYLDTYWQICCHPEEVSMALWFHDAVYQIFSNHNEADSADWAKAFLQKHDVRTDKIDRVEKMILLTQSHQHAEDQDSRLMLDIDLTILGESTDVFQRYEQNIRLEYAKVPRWLYQKKRRQILQHFFDQEWIYATEEVRQSHEAQAKDNLSWAIQLLKTA